MKVEFDAGIADVFWILPTIALYKWDYSCGWKEFTTEFQWLNIWGSITIKI